MNGELKNAQIEAARRDLMNRTLAKIQGDFARLVYLASMRDYNSGEYHHDGLAHRFTQKAASSAIAACHRDVFRRLLLCSVKEMVEELDEYARSNSATSLELVRIWEKLQPYTVTVPLDCTPLTARFFAGNVKAALAILHSRQERAHRAPLAASPRQ